MFAMTHGSSATWKPASGTTAGTADGWSFSSTGTVSHPAQSTTNLQTQSRRTRWTGGTAGNDVAGQRSTTTVCWRGDATGKGGFCFTARFSLAANPSGTRAFVGLSAQSTAVCAGDPSTVANTIGVGFDAADSTSGNWYLVYKDASTAQKVALDGTAIGATGAAPRNTTDIYELTLYAVPAANAVEVRVLNLSSGATAYAGSVSSSLPSSTSFLYVHAQGARGGSSGTAAEFELLGMQLDAAIATVASVPSIASLRAATSGEHDVVYVQSFDTPGDNGGGHFSKVAGQPPRLISATTAAGTSPPEGYFYGTPSSDVNMRLEILVGGEYPDVRFRYSIDGGSTWTGTVMAPLTAARINVLSAGISFRFTEGTYGTDNVFTATTLLDDGGTAIVPVGVTLFYYKRIYSGRIDVRWFGTKGDASTDDYDALVGAIRACPIGGSIYIPSAGDPDAGLGYRCSRTLRINKHIHIQGDTGWHFGGTMIRFDEGVDGLVADIPAIEPGLSLDSVTIRAVGDPAEKTGITLYQRVSFSHWEVIGNWLDGVHINGGIGNSNSWHLAEGHVYGFRRYGVFVHGQDANAGYGLNINVENGLGEGPGILDVSFLGNTWIACHAAEVGLGHEEDDYLPEGFGYGYSTINPSDPTGSSPPSTFIGCYNEGDSPPRLGAATVWVGFSDDARRTRAPNDDGMYLIPQQCRNLQGVHQLQDDLVLRWTLGQNSRGNEVPSVLSFRDDTRAYGYSLSYSVANRNDTLLDAWYMSWALPSYRDFAAFALSDSNFGRGAAKFIFPVGYMQQAVQGAIPRWRFVGQKPLKWLFDVTLFSGKQWEVGDRFEYTTPTVGGHVGRVCTRAGFYGDTFVASLAYGLTEYVVPTVDNGHVYEVTTAGTAGGTEPTWSTGSGSTTTSGSVTFTERGGASIWTEYGQIGSDALTLSVLNVTSGGTITLSESEANHNRIKFTGSPGAALSIVVPPGPCAGWTRVCWNVCGQTVTVKGSSGDAGVAIPNTAAYWILSDGTTCVHVT